LANYAVILNKEHEAMAEPVTWELTTRVLAVLGAVLGVFNLIVSYRQGTPRFKVSGSVDNSIQPPSLSVLVQNNGLHPITVERFWLTAYPQNGNQPRTVMFTVDQAALLPLTIEMGRAATFSCSIPSIQQAIDSGNDVIGVATSDGRSKTSRQCKNLANLARSRR
jgi:hypothetical protein